MLNCSLRSSLILVLAAGVPWRVRAQSAVDLHCDSVVGAARVDSTPRAMFIALTRTDRGTWLGNEQMQILSTIAAVFTPPRPFRLNVFEGPALARSLRVRGADTASELRPPTVTGVYRIVSDSGGNVKSV